MDSAETKQALSLDEAAHVAGVSRRKLERLIEAGRGPATYRLGSRIRVLRRVLTAWVEAAAARGAV